MNNIVARESTVDRPFDANAQLVDLWLHGRSPHTQRAYRADVARFLVDVGKPLARATLGDLQAFADSLAELAPTSQARILSAVKSLLAFGQRLGLLPVDAGAALKLPSVKNTLAQRILPEADVQQLIAGEPNRRNRVLLRLLYGAGLRVSEICDLTWQDVQERGDAGQLTVYGKGGKTRVVLLSARPRSARESRRTFLPIGSATLTPATRLIAAARSTWSRRRSATRRWPPLSGTCTRGQQIARRGTWLCRHRSKVYLLGAPSSLSERAAFITEQAMVDWGA